MRTMTIQVTQEHIDTATLMRAATVGFGEQNCPLAIAMRQAGCESAEVGCYFAYCDDPEVKGGVVGYELGPRAISVVRAFDGGDTVSPGNADLWRRPTTRR